MLKIISFASISLILSACGGSGSAEAPEPVTQAPPSLGAALPNAADTADLTVDPEFGFKTARTVDIEFDIAQARNDEASVSICTNYEPIGAEFDIDFDSCTISGELVNGAFNHSMEVTNDNDAVVAVVLFQDIELLPMYKEFTVDNNQRSKTDGTSRSVIVWK